MPGGERVFDFGQILEAPGVKLAHQHKLVNGSGRPLKILRVINAKPCCGDVEPVRPTTLQAGEVLTFTVTLRMSGGEGHIQHFAVVETDTEPRILQYQTRARIYPPGRIVETGDRPGSLPLGTDCRRTFRALTYGTSGSPPAAPDDSTVSASSRIHWLGPATTKVLDGGLLESSRPFAVVLSAAGEPGRRTGEITLSIGASSTVHRLPFDWDVGANVVAAPAAIVLASGEQRAERRVVLRSQRASGFRVLGVRTSLPGIVADAPQTTRKSAHFLRFKITTNPGNVGRHGIVTICVDDPAQPSVKIPVFIPDPDGRAAAQ